ncbi:MAG: hypothetical protein Q9180_006791 [Flavoplaca navasiana]
MSEAEEFDKWTGHQLWSPGQLDYHATFMTHAELYNMACTYQLDGLKNMAWQRLRSVMVTIGQPVTGSAVIGNLVKLIRYTYEVTGDIDHEEEPLRKLVTTFAAAYISQFEGPDVDELMRSRVESDREFVVDLMAKIRVQVNSLGAIKPVQQIQTAPIQSARREDKKYSFSVSGCNYSCRCCSEDCGGQDYGYIPTLDSF